MKKLIAFVLTLVLALSVTTVAFANPNRPMGNPGPSGQNPNQNPGGPEMTSGAYRVTVTGGGNNLQIRLYGPDGFIQVIPRAGNGTFSQTHVTASGHSIFIQVQGNSLRNATITPPTPPPRTVVQEYSFRQFVRLNQVGSRFAGNTEVSGSRSAVGTASHDAHQYHMGQSSDPRTNGVTGNGARITSLTATVTLSFSYHRNYVQQFEQIYEWVDVKVWSDGVRDEVVRPGSEHVHGGLVDGEAYQSAVRSGGNTFSFAHTGESILLHMGNQGLPHQRTIAYANDLISFAVTLHNTGNPPTVVINFTINVAELPNGL